MLGPRTRAPLGAKTTNAKARPFQIPAETIEKPPSVNSISARKPKVRPAKPEPASIEDILNIQNDEDFPEPEYMPPKPVNLPDIPFDEAHLLDKTPIPESEMRRGIAKYVMSQTDDDGLTRAQREKRDRDRDDEYMRGIDRLKMEQLMKGLEIACIHRDECEGICSVNGDRQEKADKEYLDGKQKLDDDYKDVVERWKRDEQRLKRVEVEQVSRKVTQESKPSVLSSRNAAAVLSHDSSTTRNPAETKPSLPSYMLPTRAKQQAVVTPASFSAANSARHQTAIAASRTSMGYAKGRSTSATMRGTVLPPSSSQMASITAPTTSSTTKKASLANKTNTTRAPTKSFALTKKSSARGADPVKPIRQSIFPSQQPYHTPSGEKMDMSLPPGIFMQRYGKPPVRSKMWLRCSQMGILNEDGGIREEEDDGLDFGEKDYVFTDEFEDFQMEIPA